MIHLAEQWDQIESMLRQASPSGEAPRERPLSPALDAQIQKTLGTIQVSDPSTDVNFSRFSGFTQSETSTAWCGDNVVVGFIDTGSLFETLFGPAGGLSATGVARSTNKGVTYTDLGFLNPGPGITDVLAGDPVVACTDSTTFYYASLFLRATTSDISVSKSVDGGATFGDPVSAVSKDRTTHLLDKEWMAVDPTSPNKLFVAYTDIDLSGSSATCGANLRTAIELVRSINGGVNWSAPPVVIAEVCGFDVFVLGVQVAIGPGGKVYVAWETFADFSAGGGVREIDIRKSTDHGLTFDPAVKVADVTPVGTPFPTPVEDVLLLQGTFRSAFEIPSLAVDRSGTATNGNVYLAWHNGSLTVGDALSLYCL
jgi:BNR/Asp-box repeat.